MSCAISSTTRQRQRTLLFDLAFDLLHLLTQYPSDSLANFVIKAQRDAVDKRGKFTLALSGGSLAANLRGLASQENVQWDKWCVRSVYPSNYRL
jgi:hypothetical protein